MVGAAQPGSPFTVSGAGAWFFGGGSPAPVTPDHRFVGVILVYLGIALLLGSWYEVFRPVRARPGTPVGPVAAILAAWSGPVLVGPVLFSGDVYSYVAQGQMVSMGINPYVHGPSALGRGSFLRLVDPQWRHSPAPYGPGWERLSGWIVTGAGHDGRLAVIGFRLVALFGVAVLALAVVALARTLRRDPAVALALAVLNPLVVLDLLGGSHNDALMLGLLAGGCALARRQRVVAGLALCTLAAEVKIPALIGVVFIGWWWAGTGAGGRRRFERLILALGSVAGAMVVIGAVAGLGWRWVNALSNPGAVVSWLDPVTALGRAGAHLAGVLGLGHHQAGFVDGARALGVTLAAVITIGLLLRPRRLSDLSALGWSLLAVVVLGPVVWPWYETWGLVFLAVEAEGWSVAFLFVVAALACVADMPRPGILVTGDPALVAGCWLALAALAALFLATRVVVPLGRRHGLRSARV